MVKKCPLISIIIPVYNVEPYLRRCLDSVINQTYKNLEIILIDDGSTDKSGEICEEYKKKDSRIIVIHQKNQGSSAARNAGLDIFKGEYVSFIDSDDYVDLRFVEDLYFTLILYDTDVAVCGMQIIYPDGRSAFINSLEKGICTVSQYFNNIFNSCSNKLYSCFLFKETRFTVGRVFAEDAELVSKALAISKKVSATGTSLYYYYQRNDSASRLNNDVYLFFYFDLDFLSKKLLLFYGNLETKEINFQFRECYRCLLNAKKNKNDLFRDEALKSYSKMLKAIKNELSLSSKFIVKFPMVYVAYRKIRSFFKSF